MDTIYKVLSSKVFVRKIFTMLHGAWQVNENGLNRLKEYSNLGSHFGQ